MDISEVSIGVGACLRGEPVRFNGEAKRKNRVLEDLSRFYSLETVCPEVGIGLGVPRQTIRLVDSGGEYRARDSASQTDDYTDSLRAFAHDQLAANPHWCGYIGVKGSPSCGHSRVKSYNEAGNAMASGGRGIFVDELNRLDPLLPVEEDGRLNDVGLRNSFVLRVMTYARWKQLLDGGLCARSLLEFHTRHKYLLMAHSIPVYQELGRLLSDLGTADLDVVAQDYISSLMGAFTRVPGRGNHANALLHISGYLKKRVDADERRDLRDQIELYRSGATPLVVPVTLLRSSFSRHPDRYINRQYFMDPYPAELGLRNAI